jgi:MFS family permease
MSALMIPQVTSFIQLMYQSKDRMKILGLIGLMGGIAAALGPLLAGFLLAANPFGLEWRSLFLINVPIGLLTLIAGSFVIPSAKSSHPPKIDNLGTLLIIAAFGLLLFPLIEGRELGWPVWIIALLVSSIPAFALLVWQQRSRARRHGTALLELSLFQKRAFVCGLVLSILVEMVMAGLFLTLTLLLQVSYRFTALSAALSLLPVVVGLLASISMVGGVLVPKLGRYVIALGSALLAIGLMLSAWTFSRDATNINAWMLTPGLFMAGLGIGCVIGPLFAISLGEVDTHHAGAGSGVLEAVEQLGGAIGVVVIGGVFFAQLASGGQNTFQHAYILCVLCEVFLLVLLTALSFTLPRTIRDEDELKKELGIEK